ncbi:MAG: phosphodiester glycosidase family protein, partial [Aestuariivirgaceae bacterium]
MAAIAEAAPACAPVKFDGNYFTVCRFDVGRDRIELFWRDGQKQAFGGFRQLQRYLADQGKELPFAMNAGMYNDKLAPIGLYVEGGKSLKSANRRNGPGNFHLKPNGVFYMAGGKAGVAETGAFLKSGIKPRIASQSGPMLVIGGKLHPRFLKNSTSFKRRNGVGVKD